MEIKIGINETEPNKLVMTMDCCEPATAREADCAEFLTIVLNEAMKQYSEISKGKIVADEFRIFKKEQS